MPFRASIGTRQNNIFSKVFEREYVLCNNSDQICFSDILISTGSLGRCWNPRLSCSGFNTSLGTQQMLMHRKSKTHQNKDSVLVNSSVQYKTFSLSWPVSYGLLDFLLIGPRQANLALIGYASSEGSGEPAHPRSLARTSAARSYKQWVKRNLQTESQIPDLSECLGMRS